MAQLLIVEQNPRDYQSMRAMMDFAAHQAEVVQTGQEALEILNSGSLVEAVIANLVMPGLDGLMLCRTIKLNPQLAHVPVLLLAPSYAENGENLARRAGASVLLRKPLQRDQLLAEIDRAILMASVQGALTTNPQEEMAFLRDYNQWLTRLLSHTSSQLDHAQTDLQVFNAHVRAIDQLTTALGSSLDLADITQTLVQKIGQMLQAQAVALYEHRSDILYQLRYVAGFGIPTPTIEPHYLLDEDSPFYIIQNLAGSVVFDQRHNPLVNALGLNMVVQSGIVSPLIAQGSLIGFVAVLSMDRVYDQEDADTLFSLAGVAGLSLRNAQLFTHLEDAYANLKEMDRRKSEFVAITSHELRTPIAIMLGYASLLSELETDESKKSQLVAIEKQANFLTGMVDMLINLHELQETSKRIQLRCVPVKFDRLLQDALLVTQKHGNHRKTVHIRLDCDDVQIEGDEVRLMLAFSNLIDNAIKFSLDGSEARVQVAAHPSGGAVITVEDHGIGIPSESLERIFEPFYQLEPALTRRYGGMGVGLAIVKGIVELHGGAIEVKSKVDAGSRFIVTLPAQPPQERCARF